MASDIIWSKFFIRVADSAPAVGGYVYESYNSKNKVEGITEGIFVFDKIVLPIIVSPNSH